MLSAIACLSRILEIRLIPHASFLFLDSRQLNLLSAVACLSQLLEIRLVPPRVFHAPTAFPCLRVTLIQRVDLISEVVHPTVEICSLVL
ncbi:hypothetical protein RchiOBHm_Chr2g0129821 [Rosa chinensis]|uniref:Uncharacterized protein n=1 Tax=Rosa chinensis TaxID=74649 RepID=A0A2P6RUP5_ROSCH|nr:hypothetical protein RchiOBHm_Chr2g0129821 [Rosa chinensis]